MDEKIKYWTDLAEYDIVTAEAMLNSNRLLYVAFMCHQTIEKILKAVFVKELNATPPYIHNLLSLATKSKILNKMDDSQIDFIDELEPLNIEARYPTYKDEIFYTLNYDYCKILLNKTKELYAWIKQLL